VLDDVCRDFDVVVVELEHHQKLVRIR
jgi:hypothetical protein